MSLPEKLTVAVRIDFPTASEVLVSFPDRWELVHTLQRDELPLYVAAMPHEQERPTRDHFHRLPGEINLTLTTYRMYRLFEPWPTPILRIAWDGARGEGRVERGGRLDVRLQQLGQAQIWKGDLYGLVWECYLHEHRRPEGWQEELAQFWRAVETDMAVQKVYTQSHDPAFEEGYTAFLESLGYQPDQAFPPWWSKGR